MKKLLVAIFVLGLSTSAFAENSLHKEAMGISVGMGDSVFSNNVIPVNNNVINNVVNISGRYFIAADMAITGGFGLQLDGDDADSTYFSISGGIRKYLKVADFAPFVGGKITYATVDNDGGADVDLLDLEASFGAEIFLNKQFSLEGAVGLGLGQVSVGDIDDTYFGTRTVGVRANFYF